MIAKNTPRAGYCDDEREQNSDFNRIDRLDLP